MNNYMTLDGKKYKTLAKDWQPMYDIPKTVRPLLNGSWDATYGLAEPMEWIGTMSIEVTPGDGFGSLEDFHITALKKTAIVFIDHIGTPYNVILFGPFRPRSFTAMWDAPSNCYHFPLKLVKI